MFSFEKINTEAAGVEINIGNDGSFSCCYSILKKEKNSVKIQRSGSGINNLELLLQEIPKNIPLAVVINGKGILHKKIALEENWNEDHVFQRILPNANNKEFYLQVYYNGQNSYASIIRKEAADSIFTELLKQHSILFCSVGPFMCDRLFSLVNTGNTQLELKLPLHTLIGLENKIVELNPSENNPEEISIGDEKINSANFISYSAAFTGILNIASEYVIHSEKVSHSSKEFSDKKRFVSVAYAFVMACFAVLLINYFLFDHYNKKNNELNQKLSANRLSLGLRDSLKSELDKRQLLLDSLGITGISRTSFYADRIANTLPSTFTLTSLHIFPTQTEESLIFSKDLIKAEGLCKQSADLNEWMNSLRKLDFIADVSLVNYTQDNTREPGKFLLELKIK